MQEKKQKKLLFSITKKDFDISYFSGKGAGGQHRNRHKNCVRMYHKESGARSTGQSHRERKSNIIEAFTTLTKNKEFKLWLNKKTCEVIEGIRIEEKVEKMMDEENLKLETKNEEGQWVEVDFGKAK